MPGGGDGGDAARSDEDRLAPDRDEQSGEARRGPREHRDHDVVHAPDALAQGIVDRQAAQLRREHPHGRITALSRPSRGARPGRALQRLDDVGERELVGQQARDRRRRAPEQVERGAHVARPVVEGAAQRERLVVQAIAVHGHHGVARQASEQDDRAARGGQRDGALPGLRRAGGLDHGLEAARRALAAAEQLAGRAAVLAGQGEQASERAAADDRDVLPGAHAGVVGAVDRAGQGLERRRHLGRDARRECGAGSRSRSWRARAAARHRRR